MTLRGLNPGARYVLSLFSVGADAAPRDFTLQGAMGQVAVNQNAFGNNNGIRIDYKYMADSSGSATITIIPVFAGFHLHGLANRESVPSATLYPPASLTYDGSPKNFQSGIAARNEPFVSAGVLHSVVLMSDGTVSAFGSNSDGQTTVPVGLNNVVAVSAGGYHNLALKSDGTVVAWGSNYQGQSTIPAGLSGVVAISAGKVHNLALKSNGTVVAWGSNQGGQSTVPSGLAGVVAISAGASHSMALKSDGTVVAWGVGFYNYATPPSSLNDVVAISAGEWHSLALKSDGTVVAWGNNGSFQSQVPAGLRGVVAISAGASHSVAVKSDGTVVAWGDRDNYGLTTIPPGLADVVAIDAGSEHTIALKADGTVVSFGWFRYGQKYLPTALGALTGIATGYDHTLGIRPDGTVLAWGQNTYGQTSVPAGLSGVTAVQAGDQLSAALKSDKTVVSWGAWSNLMPVGLSGVDKIAANARHVLALKTDGTVAAWGDNNYGQCNVPVGLTNVRDISAGLYGSLALKADGTVVFWGNDMSGLSYLPDSTYLGYYRESRLPGVTAISAGTDFGLALKSDGTVVAWGKPNRTFWIPPAGLSGVVAIKAGFSHALALKSDGSVVAWGGETTVPSTINGSGVIALAAGLSNSIVLRADGTIVAWGQNTGGQNSPPASAQFPPVGLPGRNYSFNAAYTFTYQGRGTTTYAASTTAPVNAGDYSVTAVGGGSSNTQNFTINKVTPSIFYYSRVSSINYGTALSGWQVDSSDSYWLNQGAYTPIQGTKVYAPAIGAILPAGVQQLNVTFLPADSVNFNPAVASGLITVTKAAIPAANITIPPLTDLTFNGLAKEHTASTPGGAGFTYSYTGRGGTAYGPSTVAPTYAGSYTVTATINDPNYAGTKSLDFAIGKATPTVTTNPTASAISYGQSLASSSLTGGAASVPGVFAFNIPGTTPSAGTSSYPVTFSPSDTTNYNSVACSVAVTTNTLALNSTGITLNAPASLVYSGSPKTFTASATGVSTGFTFSYRGIGATSYGPVATPPTNAGNYEVTATVTNPNYTGSASQTFIISKATPAITWPAPAAISYGTAISAAQLNASTSVAGAFVYTPGAGANLAAGLRTLQAVFTPSDTGNYNTVTASVPLQVTTTARPIALLAPPDLTYDGNAKAYAVSQNAYVSAGANHALVLKADGTVVAWGRNNSGQTNVPAGLGGVVQVSAGSDHSVAVRSNGTLVGWGSNSYAQCTGPTVIPVVTKPDGSLLTPVDLIGNATAAAAGGRMTAVLRADGTVTVLGDVRYSNAVNVPVGLAGVTAVAAGEHHVVALKADGTVVAWGDNPNQNYGQAVVPAGLSGVVAIAAGFAHTLALKSDGTVVAWGNNGQGQCNVPASLNGVVAITAGSASSYALKADGTAVGWPGVSANVGGLAALSVGGQHAVAIKTDGSVVGWGSILNNSGSDSFNAASLVPSPLTGAGNFAYSYSYAGRAGTTYAATSTAPTNAGYYTVTVTSTDPNFSGSKTVDFTIAKAAPVLASLPDAAIITEGQALSAATLVGGNTSVPGSFAFTAPSYVPAAGAGTQSITFTPANAVNYQTITTTVTVQVQGAGAATPTITTLPSASSITFGQKLGSSTLNGGSASVPGTFVFSSRFSSPNPGPASQSVTFIPADIANYKAVTLSVPVTVYDGIVNPLNIALIPPPSLSYDGKDKWFWASKAQFLSMGLYHWTAVKSDGTVDARGTTNDRGQTTVPVGLGSVAAIEAGGDMTLALRTDGTVIAWGDNSYGAASVPVGLTGVVAVSTGGYHSLALRADGTVRAWGDNSSGATSVPAGLINVVAVAAGTRHSLALKSDGTVVSWGYQNAVPSNLTGVIAISAGQDNSLALKADGTVVAWGDDGDGKSTVPEGLSKVVGISAGRYHSVALKADGSVVAWGKQCVFDPKGPEINLVPSSLSGVVAVSAGYDETSALLSNGSVVRWGRSFEQGPYRVNGQVYYENGSAFSVPSATPVSGLQAGFVFNLSYSGRGGTTYATTTSAPVSPGDYRVTATCTDSAFTATKVVDFTIKKGEPVVLNKPYPSFITYGQSLASYDLSVGGAASVPGTFAFENPNLAPDAGESVQNLVFTPTDTANYQPVSVLIGVMVKKAKPVLVSLPIASPLSYGQSLAASIISDGRVSVPNWWWLRVTPFLPGTFTFNTPEAVLPVGSSMQGVTFTPEDSANYTTLQLWANVDVAPATPGINQNPSASALQFGQALSASAFSGGSASVPGRFDWETPALIPGAGTSDQRYVFTPDDTVNYRATTGTAKVTVTKRTPLITSAPQVAGISLGQRLGEATLVGGAASIAGTFIWSDPNGTPGIGAAAQSFVFVPQDAEHFETVTGTVLLSVNKALASISLGNLQASYDGTAKSAVAVTEPSGLAVSLTYNGVSSPPIHAGTYEVLATIDDTNFAGSSRQLLTIDPAPLQITALAARKRYGDADPALGFTVSGLLGADALTGTLSRQAGEVVGNYAIAQGTLSAGTDYGVTFQGAAFVITPIPVTPTGLQARQTSAGRVELTWSRDGAAFSAADGFLISRKAGGSDTWVETSTGSAAESLQLADLLPGTPYSFRVAAFYGADKSAPAECALTTWTNLEVWRHENYATIENAGEAADTAAPAGDGIPNLLRYGLGLGAPARSTAGALTTQTAANGRLSLRFVRARAELNYTVETSGDLLLWASLAVNPGAVGEWVTVPDSPPDGAKIRFMRLRISR